MCPFRFSYLAFCTCQAQENIHPSLPVAYQSLHGPRKKELCTELGGKRFEAAPSVPCLALTAVTPR